MQIIQENEFRDVLVNTLKSDEYAHFGCVTGPGRSGAVAAVYASHFLAIPFLPFGSKPPIHLGPLLIIDTAEQSGRTLRKASRKYDAYDHMTIALYNEREIGRVIFWYESPTLPHRYKHELNDSPKHPE